MQQKRLMVLAAGLSIMILTVFLVLGTTQVTLAKKGGNKGKVTWSQNPVTGTIAAGDAFTATVTFTSTKDLSNVVLKTTPSLKATTVITPNTFAAITAGTAYTVDVVFTAPGSGGRVQYNGNVHLRTGHKNNPDNLKLRFRVTAAP